MPFQMKDQLSKPVFFYFVSITVKMEKPKQRQVSVQCCYFNFVVHILYSPCPVTPDGRGFITHGWSPGSRVDASCRLPRLLQWRVGRVLTAYSRGGGSGVASLIGSRLPNSHFSPLCFARRGEPCLYTMLQCRRAGKVDSDRRSVFRGRLIWAEIRNILGITLLNWPYAVVLR